MKKIPIGLFAVIFSLSAAAHAQEKSANEVPCGVTGTQAEANICARREYQKADAALKTVYDRSISLLATYGGKDQQKLRRAQTSWLRYRSATCESEASIYEGGSIRPAVYYSCLASVTRERVRRLEEFLVVTGQ